MNALKLGRKRVAVLLVAIVGLSATASVALGNEWQVIAARKTVGGETLAVELWTRGPETRYIERLGTQIVYEIQCDTSQLVSRSAPPGGVVVRDLSDPHRCRELGDDPLLGIARMARSSDFRRATTTEPPGRERYVGIGDRDGVIIELDARTTLPLSVVRDGEVSVRWEYIEVPASVVPAPIVVPTEAVERYGDLSRAAAAESVSMPELPPQIGDFVWETAFSYRSDRGGVRIYTVWSNPAGATIQLVVGPTPLESLTPGVEDQGGAVVLSLVEGKNLVQLFAPSLDTLREAADLLRPGTMP